MALSEAIMKNLFCVQNFSLYSNTTTRTLMYKQITTPSACSYGDPVGNPAD